MRGILTPLQLELGCLGFAKEAWGVTHTRTHCLCGHGGHLTPVTLAASTLALHSHTIALPRTKLGALSLQLFPGVYAIKPY